MWWYWFDDNGYIPLIFIHVKVNLKLLEVIKAQHRIQQYGS